MRMGCLLRGVPRVLAAGWLLASAACAGTTAAPAAPTAPAAGQPAGPPGAASPAEPAVAPARMTIAYATTSAANSLLQLAQDQGIFHQNGLEIELVHTPGNAGPAALFANHAHVLVSGCAEVLGAIAGGADLVYVLVNTNRMHYVLAGGPGVTTREELRGKRLGVSRIGSSSHLSTKFLLKYIGLDPERDAAYVQVGNTPERISALMAGSIDGSILTVEEGLLVGEMPGMRILVDMTAEDMPYCGNGMFFPRAYVRDNPDVIRRLTRSTVQATARFKQSRSEGVAAVAKFLDADGPAAGRAGLAGAVADVSG
jgi:ABC-type nitrate/sulfonate/bicarbonate transport system substrate-binding protein